MPDGGVDLRARQPAAADAGDRPGAGGWRLPGCGVAIHYVSGDADPLFQTDKFAATQTDPARQLAAVKEKAGDLAQRRQALAPVIQLLKQAVCRPISPARSSIPRGRSSRAKAAKPRLAD
jgi:4-phytase/acid phosphatase